MTTTSYTVRSQQPELQSLLPPQSAMTHSNSSSRNAMTSSSSMIGMMGQSIVPARYSSPQHVRGDIAATSNESVVMITSNMMMTRLSATSLLPSPTSSPLSSQQSSRYFPNSSSSRNNEHNSRNNNRSNNNIYCPADFQ